MDSLPLLIFDLDGARLGVDARRVCESIWLPELSPAEEAPAWLVGLFSLRGRIVPVSDLRMRLGHAPGRHAPGDQVVVLETDHLTMGLIVSEVIGVIELPGAAVQAPPQFDAASRRQGHLVMGEVRVGDELVTVLDVSRLTHLPEVPGLAGAVELPDGLAPASHFCPEATPAERALFRRRAEALAEAAVEEEGARMGLAVVELGGEYFGVELAAVQEFCDVAQLTPIPCCPPHILGAINLRGDLLTLIDPRAALNLPVAARGGKAVVVRFGEGKVSLALDEVHDVVYLRDEELQAPPAALRECCGAEVTGTAPFGDRTMTVLDMPALLAREEWVVDEHV